MDNISALWDNINNLWAVFLSSAGATVVYSIGAVIWGMRLNGRVKSNEALFKMYCENSEKRDEKIQSSMDKIGETQMELVRSVGHIQGKIDGVL